MEYSGAGGQLIHQKNQKQKISWHCPFKAEYASEGLAGPTRKDRAEYVSAELAGLTGKDVVSQD